jgi:FKBP-type peptidyl-prolyl cis-trans isomerase FklB
LEKYAQQEGAVVCASGLHYKVLTKGAGQIPKKSAKVICHYKGELLDGTVFDSSYKRKRPETFYINELIVGWQSDFNDACWVNLGSVSSTKAGLWKGRIVTSKRRGMYVDISD